MPTIPVYIRKANLQKWLAIENPADWINTILSDDTSSYKTITPTALTVPSSVSEVVHQTITEGEKMLRDMQDATAPDKKKWAEVKPNRPDPELGYPCCTKKTPCKHWAWSSDQEAWVNTLTGKTREAE